MNIHAARGLPCYVCPKVEAVVTKRGARNQPATVDLAHLLAKQRTDDTTFNAPTSVYDSPSHYLHGVLHMNGYGHLQTTHLYLSSKQELLGVNPEPLDNDNESLGDVMREHAEKSEEGRGAVILSTPSFLIARSTARSRIAVCALKVWSSLYTWGAMMRFVFLLYTERYKHAQSLSFYNNIIHKVCVFECNQFVYFYLPRGTLIQCSSILDSVETSVIRQTWTYPRALLGATRSTAQLLSLLHRGAVLNSAPVCIIGHVVWYGCKHCPHVLILAHQDAFQTFEEDSFLPVPVRALLICYRLLQLYLSCQWRAPVAHACPVERELAKPCGACKHGHVQVPGYHNNKNNTDNDNDNNNNNNKQAQTTTLKRRPPCLSIFCVHAAAHQWQRRWQRAPVGQADHGHLGWAVHDAVRPPGLRGGCVQQVRHAVAHAARCCARAHL
eukprot:scaffold59747_cov19-Tisochrysis_lutea.AAC.1